MVAGDVAREVTKQLDKWVVKPIPVFPSVNRMIVDMNRPEARNTEFREMVDRYLEGASYLLDVHSYPKLDVPWDVDCFLLKLRYGGNNDDIVYDLSRHLIDAGLNVAVVNAEKENDIVLAATKRGIPASLVEFSEPAVQNGSKVVKKFIEGFKKFLSARLGLGGESG